MFVPSLLSLARLPIEKQAQGSGHRGKQATVLIAIRPTANCGETLETLCGTLIPPPDFSISKLHLRP